MLVFGGDAWSPRRLALCQWREAVSAPVLTPNSVVDEEETFRIVLRFYPLQSRVVCAPVRFLPRGLEEVAFGNIRTGTGRDLAQFLHCLVNGSGPFLRPWHVRLLAPNSRVCILSAAGNNGESESIQHRGIHRRVARCSDRVLRGAGESFIEVQSDFPMAGTGEKPLR